jgi:hypothetical protein
MRVILLEDFNSDFVPFRVILEDGQVNIEMQTQFMDWVEGSDLFKGDEYDYLMHRVINDLWTKMLKSCDYDIDDAIKWFDLS